MRMHSLQRPKVSTSHKPVSIFAARRFRTIDRRFACRIDEFLGVNTSGDPQMDARFPDRSQPFVLFFCQFGRNSFLPLGIKECDIFAINLLALFCCRVGTGNIKTTSLHEIVIGVATAGLAPARKSCAATSHRRTAFPTR